MLPYLTFVPVCNREAEAEAQAAAAQPLLDVEIGDTDKLLPAGSIVSVIENMVVVQASRIVS